MNEHFNKWFAERAALEPEDVASMWNGSTYKSAGYNVELAWDAWCIGAAGVAPCTCYGSIWREAGVEEAEAVSKLRELRLQHIAEESDS